MRRLLTSSLLLVLLTGACSAVSAPSVIPTPTPSPDAVAQPAGQDNTSTAEAPAQPQAVNTDDSVSASIQPDELIAAFSEPSQTNGEVLILFGQVLDVNGVPLPGATVEIWQTDASGVYDHPGDPGVAGRDTSFQFFGMTVTDADGWYAFRTIVPGEYEPRPRHIHYKVKQSGETVLTSQFYFSDDIADVEDEGMFQAVGDSGDLLLLQLVEAGDSLLANGTIVIDTGIGQGSLPRTPSQAEGPFYPVVSLLEYDNDLVRLP